MRRACIIGYPVIHSRSPLIHGYWLSLHGVSGSYTHAEVKPEDFKAFIHGMPQQGFVGGNITIPHKIDLLDLAYYRTAEADAAGAANTLWFENGKPCVDNTDIMGFLSNLDHGAPDWDKNGEVAVLLGAGGAARGIIHGLRQRGFERVLVANRTFANSESLVGFFGDFVQPIYWQEAERRLVDADLLINSTSLGMTGQPALDLSLGHLPSHAVVTDAVYSPLETPLLEAAKLRDLRTVGGLGMLLHQAVPGFERWFGVRPLVSEVLYDLIVADLKAP
jgi:shikimate dehydrogenase